MDIVDLGIHNANEHYFTFLLEQPKHLKQTRLIDCSLWILRALSELGPESESESFKTILSVACPPGTLVAAPMTKADISWTSLVLKSVELRVNLELITYCTAKEKDLTNEHHHQSSFW